MIVPEINKLKLLTRCQFEGIKKRESERVVEYIPDADALIKFSISILDPSFLLFNEGSGDGGTVGVLARLGLQIELLTHML